MRTKKNRSRNLCHNGPWLQLPITKQVGLILADMIRTELIWRLAEMAGEALDGADVGACSCLGVVTTLEFLQHPFA